MTDFVSKCSGFRAAEDLLAVSREIMVAPGTHSYEVVRMASESVENALHLLQMCETCGEKVAAGEAALCSWARDS